MITLNLFYATNRNHIGERWTPSHYGQNFSQDRANNLRFGKVSVKVSKQQINHFLHEKQGDGEALATYLTEQLKKHQNIAAFKELHNQTIAQLPSTTAFKAIKQHMETKRDVVVFIHGFNVDWFEAVASAMALELMLNRHSNENKEAKDTSVFLFSWPSNGDMLKNRAYSSDRLDAKDSSLAFARGLLKLRDFLTTLSPHHPDKAQQECGQELHLLCHSMGNYVLQNTLLSLRELNTSRHTPKLFQHIFMCAPDVDDNVFESAQPMENVHYLARHISIYYNNGDLAMAISDYTKGHSDRLGHNGAARPNQLHNKISQVDCSNIVSGITEHSYYLWSRVNEDIRQSIDNVTFTSDKRARIQNASQAWTLT